MLPQLLAELSNNWKETCAYYVYAAETAICTTARVADFAFQKCQKRHHTGRSLLVDRDDPTASPSVW